MAEVKINKEVIIADLLNKYPIADEVIRRFSINPDKIDIQKTLEEVCRTHDIDVDELIDTLNDLLDEDYSVFSEQDEDE